MNNRIVFLIIPETGEVQAQAASRIRPEPISMLLADTFSLRPHTKEEWDRLLHKDANISDEGPTLLT